MPQRLHRAGVFVPWGKEPEMVAQSISGRIAWHCRPFCDCFQFKGILDVHACCFNLALERLGNLFAPSIILDHGNGLCWVKIRHRELQARHIEQNSEDSHCSIQILHQSNSRRARNEEHLAFALLASKQWHTVLKLPVAKAYQGRVARAPLRRCAVSRRSDSLPGHI